MSSSSITFIPNTPDPVGKLFVGQTLVSNVAENLLTRQLLKFATDKT